MIDKVIDESGDELLAAAFNILQDWDKAAAVLHDTVIHLRSLKEPPPLNDRDLDGASRYVMTAVTNRARNRRRDDARRRSREQQLNDAAPPPAASAPSALERRIEQEDRERERRIRRRKRDKLRKALDVLTPRQRAVTELVLEGRDNKAVAERLNITVSAVEKLRSRARERLRKKLGEEPDF